MATFINTNVTSLSTQNVLSKSQNALSTSIHRLATGLRVNSAIDDASGYAIANRLNSQLRGQTVAIRNTNEAISYSQFQEAALNQFNNNLQRMRELAVQSSSGTIGENERNLLNAEFLQLQQEIDRVQNNSYYNGTNAMGDRSITVQVGAYSSKYDQVQVAGIKLDKLSAVTNLGPNAPMSASANGATATKTSTQQVVTTTTVTNPAKATIYTQAQFNEFVAKQSESSRGDYYFNANNGHIYKFVNASKTWEAASTAAAGEKLTGVTGVEDQQGYLVTITSGSENSFVQGIVARRGTAWINVSDATTEGAYVINSTAPTAEQGRITYANWNGGEPNNLGNEDYTQMYTSGTWNDLPSSSQLGYVVEFGGKTQSVATTSQVQAVRTVTVTSQAAADTGTQVINGDTWYVYTSKSANSTTFTTSASNLTATDGSTVYIDGTGADLGKLVKAGNSVTLAAGTKIYMTKTASNVTNLSNTVVTNMVNGFNQFQVKDSGLTVGSADSYLDENGNAIASGTKVQAGDFVYLAAPLSASVLTTPAANTTTDKLDAVASVASSIAQSTQSLISGNSGGINILTQVDAQDAISLIDVAMEQVQVAQIQSGATQARLGAIVNSLTATYESLTAARSSIMDTDYAAETAALARAQILGQAGISMLAQANQLGQNVLKLLQ